LHVTEIFGSSETGIIAWRSQLKNKYWQSFDKVYVTGAFAICGYL